MITTVVLAFVAGFWAGNGLPYYAAGSTGERVNPSPFPDSAVVNVLLGCVMFGVAAVIWSFADVSGHAVPGYAAALAGVLAVGLIHARVWRANPWRKKAAAGELSHP